MQIPRVRLKHASLVCDRTDDLRVTVAAMSYIVARIQVFNSIYVYETCLVAMTDVKRACISVRHRTCIAHVL